MSPSVVVNVKIEPSLERAHLPEERKPWWRAAEIRCVWCERINQSRQVVRRAAIDEIKVLRQAR
jgi:hypothetical protein